MTACLLLAALSAGSVVSAEEGPFRPDTVLDATTGDWNRDGAQDLALLAFSGPEEYMQMGVYIYLRDKERNLLELALAAPGKVWGSRQSYGQEPSIRALDNGSIAIATQNFGIGRERWEHTLSLAYRNGRFVVAGLTFSYFDSLEEYESLDCDLNLLTGKGIINDKPAAFPAMSLALDEWETTEGDDPGTRICRGR